MGMVERPDRPSLFGTATLDSAQPARGIATSGWRGRSFSLGIADAVTVLADLRRWRMPLQPSSPTLSTCRAIPVLSACPLAFSRPTAILAIGLSPRELANFRPPRSRRHSTRAPPLPTRFLAMGSSALRRCICAANTSIVSLRTVVDCQHAGEFRIGVEQRFSAALEIAADGGFSRCGTYSGLFWSRFSRKYRRG